MKVDLVERLADPNDHSELALEATQVVGEEVVEGRLVSRTGAVYPIVRGIPRFVPTSSYADNFGLQWNRFRATQLDTAQMGALSRKRFDGETGWSKPVLAGKWVLDMGCGAGRFAEVAAGYGARLVALDLSDAVEATAETLRRQGRVIDVVQASALNPPFRTGAFDYAYCIGVVQHTPDRARVIRETLRCVRPGGGWAFTIYGRRAWTKANGKYLARRITRRLAPPTLLAILERTMPVVFPLANAVFDMPLVGRVARFVSPFATYTSSERPTWTVDQRYQEALLDTFDALAPKYDEPMTWREVQAAIRTGGAANWSFRQKIPVVVSGIR